MSWGWRITAFYGVFVAFMLFMVFKTTTVKDDLVSKDYYALELKYQEQIDKQNRANQLSEPVSWEVKECVIVVAFPAEMKDKKVQANIVFYNPADAKKDFTFEAVPNADGLVVIDKSLLQNGVYQIQIDWTANQVSYFTAGTVNIKNVGSGMTDDR